MINWIGKEGRHRAGARIEQMEQACYGWSQEQAVRYKVALYQSEEGFSASVPGLPGCWSQGATEQEALENIRDAIEEYLAARDELLQGAKVHEVEVGQ